MLLKVADDKSKRIALLEDLRNSSMLDARQKQWLREELGRFKKGIQGERDSAYYLDQYFKNGENHVVMHDLRFVFEGDVAQIDHLIINRLGFMFLIETKNYSGNVSINAHGEFTADYDGDRFGVPSPLEQSHRHERILQKVFERLEIANRVGGSLECHHVVMFHPKAIINRPGPAEFDTSNVIKADQFPSWHSKFADKTVGMGMLIRGLANARSPETVKEWGERLMRQHRPADLMALPDFMQPKARPVATGPKEKPVPSAAEIPMAAKAVAAEGALTGEKKQLVCLKCQSKISYPEGKYCWNNAARFGGGQYCREHQALF